VSVEQVPWLFVMIGSGLGGVALAAGAVTGWRSGRRPVALASAVGLVTLAGVYLVTLVGVSVASRGRVLPRGEVKHFCGVYLDCHLGVSVDDVRSASSVGDPARPAAPGRSFLIVTLRVSSDARRATLSPYGLVAEVVDARGRRFARSREAERALLGGEADRPLDEELAAGASYTRTLVFDLPADASRPALAVVERALPDVVLEWFLIGDEDSLFHQATLLSLAAADAPAAGRVD
jgi:hypothetical protein